MTKELMSEYSEDMLEFTFAITNRTLVETEQFLEQIERIVAKKPKSIVLREKDLTQEEYRVLAWQVKEIAEGGNVPLFLHKYWQVAKELGISCIHMPLADLKHMSKEEKAQFTQIGTSVHSLVELKRAEELGATYVFVGHIFATNCKKGLAPRGVSFLKKIVEQSHVPVYAIGGISDENSGLCKEAGAAGVCLMSACMNW